ncbi:hypothetical protein CGK05_24775, partial [Vibrio parahaemolyticus]
LREFLDSPQVSEILSELNQKSEKIELVKGVLASAESQKVLIKYISSEGVGIEDVYLTGDNLSGTDNLLLESSYNSDIQHIDVSSINNVNLGEIRYINDDM